MWRSELGCPLHVGQFAENLRAALRKAGATRQELFEPPEGFVRFNGHDLRATYVTLARANGESDDVIRRRTRHTTTTMVDYDHAVGIYSELKVGPLLPLHEAILELAEMAPSEAWLSGESS